MTTPETPAAGVVPIFRSNTGGTAHLYECPHFQVTPPEKRIEIAEGDRDAWRLCDWSTKEINGVGRRYFGTLDEALEALPAPVENRPGIRQIAAGLQYDRVWLPAGAAYIALGRPGDGMGICFVNQGFVDVRSESGIDRTWFPNAHAAAGGERSRRAEVDPLTCPIHFVQLPATGVCDECTE